MRLMRLPTALFLLALLCSGCAQNELLTKQDYQKSQQEFVQGDIQDALLDFPRGAEDGGFITTMEKSYLSLLLGKPNIKNLQQQAAALEDRVRYHVSREARTFFYVQTLDDYYASEHEVIWMHFLLSWGYSLQGKYEDACVEARQASTLLSLPWSPNGHFDDPSMRLFLATLWTMCGDWREAQVDLRAAWVMDNQLTWAKDLAEHDKAPAHLLVVMGGPGPDIVWAPALGGNPLRAARDVRFKLRGGKRKPSLIDQQGMAIEPHLSPDAAQWYERHLDRESELHEIISDSAYGSRMAADGVKASGNIVARTSQGFAFGVVAGAAIVAALVLDAEVQNSKSAGSSTITDVNWGTVLGAGAVIGGIAGGVMGAWSGAGEGAEDMKRDLDPSLHYRFVRYLPEYFWLGWSEEPVQYPVELRDGSVHMKLSHATVNNGVSVSIAQVADISAQLADGRTPCIFQLPNSSITIRKMPDAEGNCSNNADW